MPGAFEIREKKLAATIAEHLLDKLEKDEVFGYVWACSCSYSDTGTMASSVRDDFAKHVAEQIVMTMSEWVIFALKSSNRLGQLHDTLDQLALEWEQSEYPNDSVRTKVWREAATDLRGVLEESIRVPA